MDGKCFLANSPRRSFSGQESNTPRRRKRLRSLTPSEFQNVPDGLKSPLAKRKKLAADRSGLSRLKQTISADELQSADIEMSAPMKEIEEEDDEESEGSDSESAAEEIDDDFLARELEDELG